MVVPPFQGFDCISHFPTAYLPQQTKNGFAGDPGRGGLNNFALRAFDLSMARPALIQTCGCTRPLTTLFSAFSLWPWPKAQHARPGARDMWRMEDSVAKSNGAVGSSSTSFFALCFPREVR